MSIFKLASGFQDVLSSNKHITITDTELQISVDDLAYLKIKGGVINLFGVDMYPKLTSDSKKSWDRFDPYMEFMDRIKDHNVKLNHLGFGYRVHDLGIELDDFKHRLDKDFELLEESSGDEANNRWFFIKHKTDPSVPKIELVLYLTDKYKGFYCPQFQIDIDTDLSYEAIRQITDEVLGKDFFFWKYDIAGYGVVMAMAKIGQIDGVHILVGIGTNLRKPQWLKT
ncbi:MAG: hypothetical protein WC489_01610 [Patescibacteria group bacterium]